MNTKHTKGEHYSVNYAGYVTMQSTPNYDDDPIDLLNEESCPNAEANGKLYAAAPEMLIALSSAKKWLFNFIVNEQRQDFSCTKDYAEDYANRDSRIITINHAIEKSTL